MAQKYAKHVRTASADYEIDRSAATLRACTPEGYANMQKHIPPFFIDDNKTVALKPDSIDDMVAEIKKEGFTVQFVGGEARVAA